MKRVLASLSFFTRIPFWRLTSLEREHYEHVVPFWPLAGLFTGGVMALVFWCSSLFLSMGTSVVMAIAARVILTGALHEDGFADFCDGFGGGTSRERTLAIMKDSHIGTYGVLGLILYLLLTYNVLSAISQHLPVIVMVIVIVLTDVWSKMMSSMIVCFLPYARTQSEAKNRLVYKHGSFPYIRALLSILSLSAPLLCVLFCWMKRRIGGYTGDCCGATFVIVETYYYLFILSCISFL